jgi:hypothetical protein
MIKPMEINKRRIVMLQIAVGLSLIQSKEQSQRKGKATMLKISKWKAVESHREKIIEPVRLYQEKMTRWGGSIINGIVVKQSQSNGYTTILNLETIAREFLDEIMVQRKLEKILAL